MDPLIGTVPAIRKERRSSANLYNRKGGSRPNLIYYPYTYLIT